MLEHMVYLEQVRKATPLQVVGALAMTASLIIVAVGLPAQIIKIYRLKSTAGIDRKLVYSVAVTYLLWGIYAWKEPNYFLLPAQAIGFALCLVIFYQFGLYRKR